MVVSAANYPAPVQVNGFSCANCTDVDRAAKHIDPVHPRSGPFDRDAATDPSRTSADPIKVSRSAMRPAAIASRPSHRGWSSR
ncbi:hypothetical protein U1839_16950 [Sphingomonas sp. RT2P30]|uniref:hypothetical protein n=1 Tax=Parasphingomonas halimpatiens TaxID=3096162 RepID=UPI002FC67FD4